MAGLKVDEKRILSKVEQQGECWIWKGAMHAAGYGMMKIDRRPRLAHRAAYETFIGPIPDGLTIDHICRNRACVNPVHLEPVTLAENVLRGEGVAAQNARKTHCKRGHPLDEENLVVEADGSRRCRTCRNAAQRRRVSALTPEQRERRKRMHTEYMRLHRARKKEIQG